MGVQEGMILQSLSSDLKTLDSVQKSYLPSKSRIVPLLKIQHTTRRPRIIYNILLLRLRLPITAVPRRHFPPPAVVAVAVAVDVVVAVALALTVTTAAVATAAVAAAVVGTATAMATAIAASTAVIMAAVMTVAVMMGAVVIVAASAELMGVAAMMTRRHRR